MPILTRLLGLAALAVAGLGALAACGRPGSPGGGPPAPLRVGLEAAYPPFETTTERGEIVGFDVDLVRALAERLGRPLELRPMQFDSLIPELQSGRIDVVCSGMSWLPERAEVVDFSRPYVRIRMAVMVNRERAAAVKAIADLDAAGTVVAVQRGTSGEVKAKSAFPKAEIRPFDNQVDASNEVAAGRAHAFVYDLVSVRELAAKEPARLRILEGDLGSETYCMAFAKGSPLVAPADAFLVEASAPGGLVERLFERWKPGAERVGPDGK
jgi:ABC-type amino acid transport substrate-binding protein